MGRVACAHVDRQVDRRTGIAKDRRAEEVLYGSQVAEYQTRQR